MEELLGMVEEFFRDARLHLILGLIGLDLALGVAAAIKAGEFKWSRLAEFYRTMVAPYVIGYLALYVAFGLALDLGEVLDEALKTVAFGAVVANLLGSVWGHLGALGLGRQRMGRSMR